MTLWRVADVARHPYATSVSWLHCASPQPRPESSDAYHTQSRQPLQSTKLAPRPNRKGGIMHSSITRTALALALLAGAGTPASAASGQPRPVLAKTVIVSAIRGHVAVEQPHARRFVRVVRIRNPPRRRIGGRERRRRRRRDRDAGEAVDRPALARERADPAAALRHHDVQAHRSARLRERGRGEQAQAAPAPLAVG